MASFNPDVQVQQPEEFLGYSKGIGTNRTAETLFEGAGAVLEGAVQGADAIVQQNIRKTASSEVDKIRTLFGVDATEAVSSGTPPEIAAGRAEIEKLQLARQSGTVRDSYYYGKLQSVVKGLRSRYPGYEEQIDNIIQDITGVTPANAIISQLMQEAESAKSSADQEAARWQSYLDQRQKYLPFVAADLYENPAKYDTPEGKAFIRSEISKLEADDYLIDQKRATIGLEMEQGNLDDRKIIQTARLEAATLGNKYANGTYNTVNGNYPELAKTIKTVAERGFPEGNELLEIRQGVAVMRQALDQEIQGALSRPIDPNKPDNYFSLLGSEDIAEFKKVAYAPLEALEDALVNENYGLLTLNAAVTKASGDAEQRRLMENLGVVQKAKAITDLFGTEVWNTQLMAGDSLSDFQTAISTYMSADPIVGGVTLGQAISNARPHVTDPQAYTKAMDQMKEWIENPTTNPDLANQAAFAVFSPANMEMLNQFNKDQRIAVFNQFVNPKATAAIQALAATKGPMVWNNYRNWAYTNFSSLFQSAASDAQNAIQFRKYLDVRFNPEAGQFVVKQNKSIDLNADPNFLNVVTERFLSKNAIKGVTDLNRALSSIKSVVEAEGTDLTPGLLRLLESMGVDPNAPKEDSFLDGLYKAVSDWVDGEEDGN